MKKQEFITKLEEKLSRLPKKEVEERLNFYSEIIEDKIEDGLTEEQAVADNRFVLFRTDSTVYAGHLEVASAAYNLTQESLIHAFHLITQDLINGEI